MAQIKNTLFHTTSCPAEQHHNSLHCKQLDRDIVKLAPICIIMFYDNNLETAFAQI